MINVDFPVPAYNKGGLLIQPKGTLLNAASTSSVAPLVLGGASMTRIRTSVNVPHLHGKSLESILSLIEVMSVSWEQEILY